MPRYNNLDITPTHVALALLELGRDVGRYQLVGRHLRLRHLSERANDHAHLHLSSVRASAMRQVVGRIFARFLTSASTRAVVAGGSGVARCFLGKLHARGEAEFGVDVGEVGLHGTR